MTLPKGVKKGPAKRPPTVGSWAKGQSGNPGGRPKGLTEVRELAAKHAPEAIARLAEMMYSGDDRVCVAACNAILDRAIGRPLQAVEVDARVATADPRALLASVLDRLATRGGEGAVAREPGSDGG